MLGTAGLPHMLMRFYTVPDAKEARNSVVWAIWLIGIFYLLTLVLGFGAAALVGPEAIAAQHPAGNTAAPQLARAVGADCFAFELGGTLLLGVIAAVAFATILAVVAGLTIRRRRVVRARHLRQRHPPRRGDRRARRSGWRAITAVVIGIVAILGGILAHG